MAQQRLRLEIDSTPAYEFVLSLTTSAGGGGWPAPPGLAAEVFAFTGGSEMVFAHLLSVAYDMPPPRDVDHLLAAVGALHPSELRLRLFGYYVRWLRRATPPDVIAAAAGGDAGAAARFRATSYPDDPTWQAALRYLLPLSAWETRRAVLRILDAWREVFARHYQPAPLAREVEARRRYARAARPEKVIAEVLDGWEYVPEPGIQAVLLVPSSVIWPMAHVFDHHSTKLICYPVPGGAEVESAAPPADLLALAQAVGDERRLRVLRELAAGEQPAQELAIRLGIGLTTLVHHLGVLTRAGLLSPGGGHRKVYRLRREVIAELGSGLERYLAG